MQCTDSGDAHAAHLSKESLTDDDESSTVVGEGLYSVVVEVLLIVIYSL